MQMNKLYVVPKRLNYRTQMVNNTNISWQYRLTTI